MKRKIDLLIAFSAIVLVALCAVQFYLVKTTYDYKVEQFHTEVRDKIAKMTNDYSDIDSTIFNKKDLLYKQLAGNYIQDKSTRFHIKNVLLQNEFRGELTRLLKKEFEKEIPDFKINFAIVLNKFVIFDKATKADTIYAEKPYIGNKLYGDLASLDNAFQVRSYVGTTGGNQLNLDYKLLTEDTLYVSVAGSEQIILKRMSMVFIFAVFSILTLVTLFTIAIKALIKQKKISDIKTDFINNITHELKTPLTTLSVSAKMLGRQEVKDNEVVFNTILDTVNRQNNRLQDLIDQVMTNSLGYAEMELKKETIAANTFLQNVIADFKLAYPNVPIATSFDAKETALTLDKFYLTTAITNVLENAVKYGCKNITVKTSLENNQFNISIQDDGIGISKSKQPLLFDKFYRVQEGNLHNAKGLGLGLYYVDQIIKAHKGSIDVVSDLGKGAIFNISIPSV